MADIATPQYARALDMADCLDANGKLDRAKAKMKNALAAICGKVDKC